MYVYKLISSQNFDIEQLNLKFKNIIAILNNKKYYIILFKI